LKKIIKPIQRVGIIANSTKISGRQLVKQAARLIQRSGREVRVEAETASMARLRVPVMESVTALTQEIDLLLVFGGDGTMLRVARDIGGAPTPILGINIGGLGFLTDVPSSELESSLERVWAGEYSLENRALIEAEARTAGETLQACALNDFVISRGIVSRLIELDVHIDGQLLTRYRCDGLIISSPTGSTAYSLSAGGAIVHPTAEVFTLTPICPHTLSNRSVIFSLASTIVVTVAGHKYDTILSSDGQNLCPLHPGDTIQVKRSRHNVRLVHPAGTTFFETLRRKLDWSGSHV
jgi:NAD+ kinase